MYNRFKSLATLGFAVSLALSAGCAEQVGDIDRTQPHRVKKSVFSDGSEWYVQQTLINPHWEGGLFTGFQGGFDKVRWEITEDALIAYRTYELIKGGDGVKVVLQPDEFRGQPVASFPISSHFDIQRDYNPLTGEETNVIVENTMDRPWFDREFMRVDWGGNDIFNFTMLDSLFQADTGYYENRYDDPNQWYLSRKEIMEDGTTQWVRYYDDEVADLESADYMNVLTRAFFGGGGTSGFHFDFRTSFMKKEPSTYQALYYPDEMFEKFGYFRNERLTYDLHRGLTDFLDFHMNRWHIWEDSTDADGRLIPMADRTVKPIRYWASPELYDEAVVKRPDRFIETTKETVDGWNVAFTDTVKHYQPNYEGRVYEFMDNNCRPENVLPMVAANQRYLDGVHNGTWSVEGLAAYVDDMANPSKVQGMLLSDFCDRMMVIDRLTPGLKPQERFSWQKLGDLRYPALNYVGKAEFGSPLGYGPSSADPETGEIIYAAANIYGGALEGIKGYLYDLFDLLCASGEVEGVISAMTDSAAEADTARASIEAQCFNRLDDFDIVTGENVRKYFQNLSQPVFPPRVPQVDFLTGLGDNFQEKMSMQRENFEELRRLGSSDAARMVDASKLHGSHIEKMLIDDEVLVAHGISPLNPDTGEPVEISDDMLEKISPIRNGVGKHLARANDIEAMFEDFRNFRLSDVSEGLLARHNILMPDHYSDVTVSRMIFMAHTDADGAAGLRGDLDGDGVVTRDETIDWMVDRIYRGVMEHEIGHTIGLRHNFEGSFDEEGYFPEYWDIINELPDVDVCEYADTNEDGTVSDSERGACELSEQQYNVFLEDHLARKREQEQRGIDLYKYASIMDYGGQFYTDNAGLGAYDIAAIKFGYGQLREVYDGAPGAKRDNRVNSVYYLGGEVCDASEDCPFQVDGQTCGHVPDFGSNWQVGPHPDLGHGFCSNWDRDQLNNNVSVPVHRFCSDERVQDRPFCNRWDEGKSSLEIVENMIETYDRQYIFNNFRRYNLMFGSSYISRVWGRYYRTIGKQYQALLYGFYYDPGFQFRLGGGGFTDMFTASIRGMNFFSRILSQPDVGTYLYNPLNNTYERRWSDCEVAPDGDYLNFCIGPARHMYTRWETGYFGAISRVSRFGTFIDKIFALQALSTRDWGFPRFNDETFPINFYDGFPNEMLTLFAGYITQDINSYAALAPTDEQREEGMAVEFRDLWEGGFFGSPAGSGIGTGTHDENRERRYCLDWDEDNQVCRQQRRLIEPPGSFNMPIQAMIYAIFNFGVFYDTTFYNFLRMDVYTPSQPREQFDPRNEVRYESPLFNRVYRAPILDDGGDGTDRGITSVLIREANRVREEYITVLEYGDNPPDDIVLHPQCQSRNATSDDKFACQEFLINFNRNELQRKDSFLNIAADLLAVLGLAWF